jgi:hypothetical protein
MEMNRKIVSTVILVAIVVIIVATTFSYYALYPNVFQVSGRFSVRGLDLTKSFEGSTMITSFLVFKTFDNEQLNVSLEANTGWTAESLTLYNISSQEDTILFQTNGSVSLNISQPTFLFMNLQNLSVSVPTGPADEAFFLAEAGGSLLLTNVTSAYVPFPPGSIGIDLQVEGGNISISGSPSSVSLDNADHGVLIRLMANVLKQTNLVAVGRFQVESNTFSSVQVDCWSSPIDTYFTFADGFLSYSGISQQISGSQNLNLTGFKGAITLINSQPPHEITIQGSVTKIQLGESEVTAPNPLRDLVQTLTPYSGFILIVASVGLSQLVEMWKDRRKERKEKATELSKEIKDNLCAPLLQNLEDYFEPQVRLRELGTWVFLGGFVSHDGNAVDSSRLELNVSMRLLVEAESGLPDLHKKVEKFTQLLKEYNEAYGRLAKTVEPLIDEADSIVEPNLMTRAGRSIAAPKDIGGAYEWAFMLLLGANEDDLVSRLDEKQKDVGQRIFRELQKHDDVMNEVRTFGELVGKLQTSLADLKVNLEELMKSQMILWET